MNDTRNHKLPFYCAKQIVNQVKKLIIFVYLPNFVSIVGDYSESLNLSFIVMAMDLLKNIKINLQFSNQRL